MTDTGGNNRVYHRIPLRTNVVCTMYKSHADMLAKKDAVETKTVTADISAGGLTFVSRQPLLVGALVELRIEWSDGGKPIECLSRIVRVDATQEEDIFHTAVLFLDIVGADRARVEKYVDANLNFEKK